ncbi:hypothetical protein [Methylobacterium sp. WL9]|uniref:hypothetical protein n=1 Tax=Methylobacterium sp. WL9 TaxID=2603898 RepID=UPI0011C6F253|nr:hypothetical protein [Methylobacterium sp. WL9]TXN24013.1 hypothetical protein FV217_04925 [Methylobacterium sp. WL9]
MPRRPANVTQADIARAIRAMKAAGFDVVHVVLRDGGVVVEPVSKDVRDRSRTYEDLAAEDEVVVL